MRSRPLLAAVLSVAASLAVLPALTSPASAAARPLSIQVVSTRADLVSGGDALLRVPLPSGVSPSSVRMSLNGRDVTSQFARRPDGTYAGLLTGLRLGDNTVRATAPGWSGSRTVTNHPQGGPIFAGPQLGPYQCQAGAKDAQCNQAPTYSFLYKSTDPTKQGLQPYDPKNPPSDVATTTTDQGRTVPFVVRREDGMADRDRYSVLTLFTPGKGWKPWAAQKQWNHKVLVTHGGGCGASFTPGTVRLEDYAGTIPFDFPGTEQTYVTALGKGFAVASAALNNTGHQCNLPQEAEAMMMLKERVVEAYGPIRYTIGTGCSGGSIAQHTIANAYPGIYQGLVTTCSYPDVLTAGAQFADYHLLRNYFENPQKWGAPWSPTQMADVEGHLSHVNAVVADEGLFKEAINPESACPGSKDTVPGDRTTRYDSETNPGGVRCSILDMMVTTLGKRPSSVWTPWEKAAGTGFTGVPFANQGVMYGFEPLKRGTITLAQFLDLNEKVGGLDINADHSATRIAGDPVALRNVYRSGLVNEADHMSGVAMINHGGPDPGIAHDYAHAFWTEERLQRAQGDTDNRVMWFGTTPLIGDPRWAGEAFLKMDKWLAAVEKDRRDLPLATKIAEDRPADVTDRCQDVPGVELVGTPAEPVCRQDALQLHLSTPREQAGDDVANDRVACRLKPLTKDLFSFLLVPLSDVDLARLQKVFPDGVCDYSRPGIGQGPAETWLTYGTPTTPTYGGTNLPARPAGSATGWQSASFAGLLAE
ncbi:DUF6351 family protein [Nocardioides marmoribigeumensis]|uniref:DUF6351 domain-containing protein n=1 Tax=Nocardioides marmoribigeumensis TaxID=433649 RepID=A0ABU2BYN7_9ACTN|nr:DUF6351 family protein [Nocardioides marmoribigeumensis]MDR7363505.1 hypothetical protein [Nocardioides marmoribigeumensis]